MALYPCDSSNGGGGGSTVVPNPTGEAVGELTSIGIDGNKYSISGGGGAYTTTVLFTNGASGDTTFQLSSAYTNFDAIAIYYSHFDGQDQYEDVRIYPTTFLNSVSSTDEVLGFTNDAWYYYFSVYSTTEFRYVKSNAGYITDIIGIKYGSNSGGGAVTGVKGSAESTYRTGNVDISAANIGLGNVDNTSDLNKPISTATQTALNGKVDTVAGKGLSTNDYDNTAKGIVDGVTSALAGKVSTSSVGSANGVAELDANGRVPSSQLPSYVDDTVEGYLNSVDGKFYVDSSYTTEITGETGKIYVTLDTNKTYRWSGSGFVEISESLALGETSSTAYAGNKGKANADAIAGIKNGTSINSFGAVETALQSYATQAYVNGFFANLGSFTVNDLNAFFKSSVIAFHQLNPIAYRGYSVVTDWAYNGRFTGFFTDYNDSVDFVIAGGDNKRIFCGRYLLQADVLEVRTYMNSDKEASLVNINSAYDADTDWNIVKQGDICILNMRNLKDIPSGATIIGTIPVGFRPEWGFYEYVYSDNTGVHLGFNFANNGEVMVLNSGTALSGTVYVNRNVTYFTA